MSTPTPAARWGRIHQLLHWGIAAMILGLAAVGLWMTGMPNSMDKLQVYALHKSFGITVLALVLLRLGWRLVAGRPPALPGPAWQTRLAGAMHGLLYLLMLAMPLSGWLYNSASNFPLRWFGVVTLPALSGPSPGLKAIAGAVHEWGFWLLALLVAVHAGAAIKHHLVDRDATLARMLPRAFFPPPQDDAR